MNASTAELMDFAQSDPLYDVALEQVAPCAPAAIQIEDPVLARMMIELMCVCWMRGAWWCLEAAERQKAKQ